MLLRTFLILCLAFFYFEEALIDAWPTLQVTILNYTQTYASEYVEYTMVPSKISGGFDVRLNVLRDNLKLIVKIGIYFENVEFMNKTVNVCKVARNDRFEPLLKLIFKVLTDHPKAKVPKQCPIKKGEYSNFLLVETDKIPPVWPEKNVSIFIDVYSNELNEVVPIISQYIYCQFKKKKLGN